MICTMEEIGKSFLKQNDAIEFKKEFKKLESFQDFKNLHFHNFIDSAIGDRNQFESFILLSIVFFEEFQEDSIPIIDMSIRYGLPLALKINFILWALNNFDCDGEILKLIDLPYNDIFEKFNQKCHIDDIELKKVFEKFFSQDDELFDLILKLRNDFHNSNIFKKYVKLLNLDDSESEYYKNAIKSHFYIIKDIIFQVIIHEDICIYDDNNVLKFYESTSAEGSCFDMKIIHANIKYKHIIKIDIENHKRYAWISSTNIKVSKNKGTVIRIKGEFINSGFGKYSKNMKFCSEKIDNLKGFNLPQEFS